MYISSDKIKVFPFAKYRGNNYDLGSRLFYENNISRLIYQLIDTDGFIISGNVNNNGVVIDSTFDFNLKGYYFSISAGTSLVPADIGNADAIYAQISLTDTTPAELQGQDNDDNNFEPLQIVTQPSISENTFNLKLLDKTDNRWQIAKESYVKFNPTSLNITKIDGKH